MSDSCDNLNDSRYLVEFSFFERHKFSHKSIKYYQSEIFLVA